MFIAERLPWPPKLLERKGTMLIINYMLVTTLLLNLLYTVRLIPKQKIGTAAVVSLELSSWLL